MPAQPYPLSDAPKKPRSAMGLTSSRGKRPARLHSSMMGIKLSSMNLRAVSRTNRSSSLSRESNSRKSTPRNLMAMGFSFLFLRREQTQDRGRNFRRWQRGQQPSNLASGRPEFEPAVDTTIATCNHPGYLLTYFLQKINRCSRQIASKLSSAVFDVAPKLNMHREDED